MKRALFWMVILILVTFTFLPNTFAQDYTQFSLPDGAKARIGKGFISGNIAYSPMALGLRWRVVSVFGSMIRQPIKRSLCSRGIRTMSVA